MKKIFFFLWLMAVLTLQSCFIKDKTFEEYVIRIENSMVDNVYQHVNMVYFHGFVDRQTVDDLIKYHGEPDSIFDAYEATTIEGYDIYEYRFDDGAINCYVPHNKCGVKYVDYIYYEFMEEKDLSEVVTDSDLVKRISNSGADVYYVVDPMHVFLRLNLNPRDKSKVGNIALNDVSFLEERKSLSDFVSEIDGKLPLEYEEMGSITSVQINKDTLRFFFLQDYIEQDQFLYNLENSTEMEKCLVIFMFGPSGNYNYIAKDIIDEKCNLAFDIEIGNTGKHKHYVVSCQEFAKLFEYGITSHDILTAYITINNLGYPFLIDDGQGNMVEFGRIYLTNGTLVYPVVFKSGTKEAVEDIEKRFLANLMNVENPDRMTIYHAVRDNKGLTVDFFVEKSQVHNPKIFTREETIKLYQSISNEPQSE